MNIAWTRRLLIAAAVFGMGAPTAHAQLSGLFTLIEGNGPTGFYEAFNADWGIAPGSGPLDQSLHYSVTNRTHNPDADYVSISFFPQSNLQINRISQLGFDLLVPAWGELPNGAIRAEILLNDVDGPVSVRC